MTLSRLFKKNKLNATSHTWELIKLYALVTNGLCVVFFENREHNVLKLDIAAVQFSSCCWRTGTKLMLIPVSACAKKDGRTFSSQVTYGATGALTIYFILK